MSERDPNYDDWDVRGDHTDQTFVGVTAGGVPVFHERTEGDSLFPANVDEEARELIPDREGSPSIEPGETLGEALERIGDELGWDSLSAFGREHLESE